MNVSQLEEIFIRANEELRRQTPPVNPADYLMLDAWVEEGKRAQQENREVGWPNEYRDNLLDVLNDPSRPDQIQYRIDTHNWYTERGLSVPEMNSQIFKLWT